MLGPVHNTNPHSRPSTGSAAEEGQPPAPASARGGRATTPSQSSEEQPCPETPKGNASPLQPFVRLPTDSSEGKLTPLQPAKGQPSAAATQNKVSLAGASVQDGQGALQAAHRAAPGRPGRSQSSSTSLASTKHAAGLTPSGAVTSDRNAATRKACKPGHSSLSSKVSSAGKRAVAGQTRTQDLSGALATISTVHPIAAAVKDNRATTSSAAVSTDTLGLASNKAQSDAQPTYKRQTTFGFDGVEEQLGAASTSQAVILHSEGSFTKQIMQQMSYTGSHEDHNHLFLEVHFTPLSPDLLATTACQAHFHSTEADFSGSLLQFHEFSHPKS